VNSYKYYITKTGKYIFTLFVETKKDNDFLVIVSCTTTTNSIWGHKKKSCRCILRSFYGCVWKTDLMRKDTFYRYYTIIKSGQISKDLLIEKFPQLKFYGIL